MTEKPLVSANIVRWILTIIVGLVAYKTAQFAGYFLGGGEAPFVDTNAFYIAGQMAWAGNIDRAYHAVDFLREQRLVGPDVFMPWTYPPPFNLVCALFALLPQPLAYLLFTGATLAAYLWVVRRLAGEDLPLVLAAAFPAILVNASCGQNGFLSGFLLGLACLLLLRGSARAGMPLGLMVVKPHLAVPLALYVVVTQRWHTVAVAALTVALACGAATLAFGTTVWPSFLHGMAEAKVFLSEGMYPLRRMVSAYATVRSFGGAAPYALAAQIFVALALLAMLAVAMRRRMPERQVLGLALAASPLISPYAYDYDLCVYGVALALLMPDLKRLMSEREQLALLGLSIFGGVAGLMQHLVLNRVREVDPTVFDLPGLGSVPLLLAVALIWRTLERENVAAQSCAATA